MILTGLLAAVTGAYPMIIKASFDMLMQDQKGMLPYVLAAIVGATMLRSILLYAQTVETNRIVMRLTTDMQRVGFEHLITSDFARLSRETPGRLVSKLTNDIGFVQVAAPGRPQYRRARRADDRRARRLDDLPRLGHVGDRAVRLPDRRAARRRAQHRSCAASPSRRRTSSAA